MGLIFRTSSLANAGATSIKNAPLTYEEGDGNFAWLATNLSGSTVTISGSVDLSGSLNLKSLVTIPQSNVVTIDTTTGQLFYTASSAFGGSGLTDTSSLLITASATDNVLTFTKGNNTTFTVNVSTGSLFGTSSWAQNAITASHAITSISASYALSSSFALSASWAPAPTIVLAVSSSGSTIYSTNPSTSNFSTVASIFLGTQAGTGAGGASNSNFIGVTAGYSASNALGSNFIGDEAGYEATDADLSNFIGNTSGYQAAKARVSNFIGDNAGYQAISASNSNFIGTSAGTGATRSNNSNFIGYFAGQDVSDAGNSNFIGALVGQNAMSASNSTFIGTLTGVSATYASQSVFIGSNTGLYAASASYSTFLGFRAGARSGSAGTPGPGANNIIIGTGVTLPDNANNEVNIGGIIYATGSWFNTGSSAIASPTSGSKVGINTFNPQYNLDVSGSGRFSEYLVLSLVSSSLDFANDAAAAAGGVPLGGVYRNGGALQIRLV